MRERQVGEVVSGRSRIWRASRVRAVLMFGVTLGLALTFARTGTTTITTGARPATAYCHVCNQHGGTKPTNGGNGGTGGTIHIGS